MNHTQVKFKTTASSNLTANDLLGKDCEGAFIYSSTAKKLYLFDGSQVIPIGKNIFQIDENNPNQSYEDNTFYTNSLGELYFIFGGIKYEIARASDISANNQNIQGQIDTLDSAITSTNTTINALSEKVGNPGAIGDDTKKSTGIYEILDEKVNNIVFEGYKTEQANAFAAYKIEAENKFLSADEELFLTDGIFFENYEYASKDNKYVQWSTELNLPESDKKTGPCIVLTIKNSTTSNPTENTIIIPAGELVDVYTAKDTDTIDMSVNGLEISADVKTANLIKSQSTDDVVLSVGTDNKITTSFNTANIINQDATNTVQLSVEENVVSADVVIDNLIAVDGSSVVYLAKDNSNKLVAKMQSGPQSVLDGITKTTEQVGFNKDAIDNLTKTLSAYGINNPEENKPVLGEGLIKTAIAAEEQTRGQNDAALGERIDGISTKLSTLNSYVESIYKYAKEEESASGVLQKEIENRESAISTLSNIISDLAGENNTSTVAGNAAAISEIAKDYMKASEAYTAENAKAITISDIKIVTRTETENPSGLCLEITYDDSAKEKSYYSISDLFTQTGFTTGMSNYYTIEEANAEFLSANEELFLTDGVFNADYEYGEKDGKYYEWEENKGYEKKTGPCIVLTVKNSKKSEDTDFKENTIIIPASNLVDTYTENNTGHNIAVAVSGYTISADLDVADIIGSDATHDIVILEKAFNENTIKASLNSTFTDRITTLEGREDTYTTGLISTYAAENIGDGIDESFIIKLTQSGDKAPAEDSEVNVNILSDLNTYIATKDYATHKDSEAAAKTVYNQAIPAPEENEGEETIYPLLARKGIQKTTASLTDELTESYSLMDAYLTHNGYLYATKIYGAVWNDYAEYRQTHHKVRPGQCVYEKGDGSLAISYERMMPGANIVSDTFGFAIGETNECKTPLAVSGRVLAYPYESKETYNPGDAVCSGPNGTISKMTRAEIRDYPERIVGTVSEIPTYEVWGSGNIKVNGRIWIKVR